MYHPPGGREGWRIRKHTRGETTKHRSRGANATIMMLALFIASVTGHCGRVCQEQLRKISPPPPPPMDKWSAQWVAALAKNAGLNDSTFVENDVDGSALHEMWIQHNNGGGATSSTLSGILDTAADKPGPKMRFLHFVRRWSQVAARPAPPPPPPSPPAPSRPPPPPNSPPLVAVEATAVPA